MPLPAPRGATDMGPREEQPPVYSGDKVRGADIVLRKPWERGVFIAGLVGAVIVGLVLAWLAWWPAATRRLI